MGRKPLLGHQFSFGLCLPILPLSPLNPPFPSPSSQVKPNFFYLHISKVSPALYTIIIALSLPLLHNPGHLSLSLPHLSISARLGTAGVPLTTSLHWLLLMWNLPSGHLLDVRQRDTEGDRQSVVERETFTDCFTDGVQFQSLEMWRQVISFCKKKHLKEGK